MPPLPPVPGALKVQLRWGVDEDTGAMTVFHLAYTGGPPSASNCTTMAAAIQADAKTRFLPLLNEDSFCGLVTVLDLSSDMGGEGTGGLEDSGSRAGAELSAGTAVVVSKHVARHYRGGHPRSYLPFGVTGDIAAGLWTGSFPSDVKAAWDAFISDCTSDGTGCVITGEISISYRNAGAPRVTPVKDAILSTSVGTLVGSQRRRNRKQ